jgi:NCAIR mutase (PurE)-related protein
MELDDLHKILEKVKNETISIEAALQQLIYLPYQDLGYARVDHHRNLRQAYPEVIYCPGKTIEQIKGISRAILNQGSNLLATRASQEVYLALQEMDSRAIYHEIARLVVIEQKKPKIMSGTILVMSAGTSDIPVAEEAALVAESFGNQVKRLYDVGVAGIHRLLDNIDLLNQARVIVTVAGMDGALASVVGGIVDKPVIAVPTSVGYGSSFGGLAALLTMLNSCASGVSVVNIDNGFGAGYLASIINRQVDQALNSSGEQI